MGDSSSDEYAADDDRPAFQWTELIAAPSAGAPNVRHHRFVDLGPWGRRGEPRRTGYERNWARSGSQMDDVVEEQLPGVVAQIRAGEVTHVYLSGTGNEWGNPTQSPFLIRDIYSSPDGGVTGGRSGRSVASLMRQVFEYYEECMERIAPIVPGALVVAMPAHWNELPQLRAAFPDPARRAYVGAAIDHLQSLIEARAAEINQQQGRTAIHLTTYDALLATYYGTDDGRTITVAGVPLIYTSNAPNGEPNYVMIAPQSAVPHLGTIANGVIANTFIAAANRLDNVDITPFTSQEMRENAGIFAGP